MRGGMPVSIITQNVRMRTILKRLGRVAESDSSVLLVGETGSGKEIFADYIHNLSSRNHNPIVKIGLSALPSDLMASELFGHEKGAFTGAESIKKGLFELADHGSLFLDDIDDVPAEIQAKLLRVLESREMMRIGGLKNIPIDIRLISASKVDLNELVKRNMFRSDLFYRINVVTIDIPPLRERTDDIPLLVDHFLRRFAPNRKITVTPEAMSCLTSYYWPGNIRELRNVIQRAALFAEDIISYEELSPEVRNNSLADKLTGACMDCFSSGGMSYQSTLECLEYKMIREALRRTSGNQSHAARLLNLSLSTFRDKMAKFQKKPADC